MEQCNRSSTTNTTFSQSTTSPQRRRSLTEDDAWSTTVEECDLDVMTDRLGTSEYLTVCPGPPQNPTLDTRMDSPLNVVLCSLNYSGTGQEYPILSATTRLPTITEHTRLPTPTEHTHLPTTTEHPRLPTTTEHPRLPTPT